MIIFDLDATLADCEHRRHFIDPSKRLDCYCHSPSDLKQMEGWYYLDDVSYPKSRVKFTPDYKSFYDDCDKDTPIWPVVEVYEELTIRKSEIQIWSGRCDSVREKTIEWLKYIVGNSSYLQLRMRPIGNTEPDDQLKERWFDEYLNSMYPKLEEPTKENQEKIYHRKNPIDFVFDSDPKSIKMWRRRGIFVFNCAQHDEEF